MSENGNFKLQTEFEQAFNIKTKFVQFQGMIQAVKLYLRRNNVENFTKNGVPYYSKQYSSFHKIQKGGKDFYVILNRNEDKTQMKWENIYDIEEETWKTIYLSPLTRSIGTKLQTSTIEFYQQENFFTK